MSAAQTPNRIHVFDYNKGSLTEKEATNINECIPYKDTDSVTWINIDRVPPIEFVEKLRLGFDLHPVIEDDILALHQRPKVEILDDYLFVRLRMFHLDHHAKKARSEQVSIVVAKRFLITFQQGIAGDTFELVRTLIRKDNHRIRTAGTDYLCYELIDSMVLGFFDILEHISNRIEHIEREIVRDINPRSLQSLNTLKSELIGLRRAAWPLREVITQLERSPSPLVKDDTRIYLRDVYTKLIQVTESLEIYREMISSLQDFYHLRVNSKTNDVMKVLTVITTIFMPLSFVVGFYGMNFAHLPGAQSPMGPFYVFVALLVITIAMLGVFIYKRWL